MLDRRDVPSLLSSLWIFAMLNYLYADVMSLMDASVLRQLVRGHAGSLAVTPALLFGAAILMEIPIAMTILSRLLPYRANRWANIAAAAIKTAAVAGSLFVDAPSAYYLFFAVAEIACTSLIAVLAWRWKPA